MFRNKNKKKESGSFEVKRKNNFFRKKNFVFALLIFILATSVYLSIKPKNKTTVSSTTTAVSNSELPGWWLQKYFGTSVCNQDNCRPDADPDHDGLTNAQEYFYHTDPLNPDSNNNGMTDGQMVANNLDPSKPGKVPFDQVVTDESILGESLVFDSSVKQLINDMTDSSKIKLPEVKTEEIIVSKDDSKEARTDYLNKLNLAAQKYFNFDVEQTLKSAAKTGNIDQIDEIKIRALKLSIDLKALPTPPSTAQLHKYFIGLVQLIPKVVSMPDAASLGTDTSANNLWYDDAQAYFVLLQKIAIEKEKIKRLN